MYFLPCKKNECTLPSQIHFQKYIKSYSYSWMDSISWPLTPHREVFVLMYILFFLAVTLQFLASYLLICKT